MSVSAPTIDSRTYQTLLDDAMARIATHNPEWTNFNHSDPGITLLELFAFLTDTLLYRANLIPDRNRLKFLNLLGVPLTRASTAIGLITLSNDHGPLQTQTCQRRDPGPVRVGHLPHRRRSGPAADRGPGNDQAGCLEPSLRDPGCAAGPVRDLRAARPRLQRRSSPCTTRCRSTPMEAGSRSDRRPTTRCGSRCWSASSDAAASSDLGALIETAKAQIGSSTLNLGFVPVVTDVTATDLQPSSTAAPAGAVTATIQTPSVPEGGQLPTVNGVPQPAYAPLDAIWPTTGLDAPGVVQITLPSAAEIGIWSDVDALSEGVGLMPPNIANSEAASRLITWLQLCGQPTTTFLWAGINATTVTQRTHVTSEVLPAGTGAPDQTVTLAHTPVIDGSVTLAVTEPDGTVEQWTEIDDLLAAPPEVPVPTRDCRPGRPPPAAGDPDVYTLDTTTGIITFGDGARGRRPPVGAALSVDYDYGAGSAGNVGTGAINNGVALPAGVTVSNPVPTWGGADAESIDEAEKQVARYLQYRDRCVTIEDFQVVTYRTPGVDIGRVEVIPATNPDIVPVHARHQSRSGDDHGDSDQRPRSPDRAAAQPGDGVRDRRLPRAAPAGDHPAVHSRARVRADLGVGRDHGPSPARASPTSPTNVKTALTNFLAPIDPTAPPWYEEDLTSPDANPYATASRGWPLQKCVNPLELQAVASRVDSVDLVEPVLVSSNTGQIPIPMTGLQLPQVAAISVISGQAPTPITVLQGTTGGAGGTGAGGGTSAGGGDGDGNGAGAGPQLIPVPVIPDTC